MLIKFTNNKVLQLDIIYIKNQISGFQNWAGFGIINKGKQG